MKDKDSGPEQNVIEYQGERFRLSGNYSDYEEYSDSIDPIASQEHERVAAAVRGAAIPDTVATPAELVRALIAVKFPGFEGGTLVVRDKSQAGKYYGMQIMIPYTERSRLILYEQKEAGLKRLQDAEADRLPRISSFAVHPDRIEYFRVDGTTVEFSR